MDFCEFSLRLERLLGQKRYKMTEIAQVLGCTDDHLGRVRTGKLPLSDRLSEKAEVEFPRLECSKADLPEVRGYKTDDDIRQFPGMAALEKEMQEARERNRKRVEKLSNPMTEAEKAERDRIKMYWEGNEKPPLGQWPWTIHKGRVKR